MLAARDENKYNSRFIFGPDVFIAAAEKKEMCKYSDDCCLLKPSINSVSVPLEFDSVGMLAVLKFKYLVPDKPNNLLR